MTTFYLVRHGNKEGTSGDPGLSSLGRLQTGCAATFLRTRGIARVYTSPLARGRETATHIASALNVPLVEDGRLRERMNWGDSPGQSFEAFVQLWERCSREREYAPPGGISARQAGEQMEALLRELYIQYPHDAIAVVTHGGVINDFLVNLFPLASLTTLRPDYEPLWSSIIKECSITTIRFDGERFEIETLAGTKHLP